MLTPGGQTAIPSTSERVFPANQGVSASPHSEENLFLWSATILGPQETPWEGGIFNLRLTFDEHVRSLLQS